MTPEELAKSGTEHGEQTALFAYLNCAALHGFAAADDERSYKLVDREQIPQAIKLQWRALPHLAYVFAIHNQGHGDAIRGGRARAEGVKKGAPDICLPYRRGYYSGGYIELKRLSVKPKRAGVGGVAPDQSRWHDFLLAQRYFVTVCYGWKEAVQAVKWYEAIKLLI